VSLTPVKSAFFFQSLQLKGVSSQKWAVRKDLKNGKSELMDVNLPTLCSLVWLKIKERTKVNPPKLDGL
jgi:hypothetical protein